MIGFSFVIEAYGVDEHVPCQPAAQHYKDELEHAQKQSTGSGEPSRGRKGEGETVMSKTLWKLSLLLLLLPIAAEAQIIRQPFRVGPNDPATCSTTDPAYLLLFYNTTSNVVKYCSAANTWSVFGGAGSFTALSDVTDGKAHDYTGAAQWDALCFEDQTGTLVVVPCTGSVQAGYQMHSADGGVLEDTDDINDIFINTLGVSITITKVTCKPDTGGPTIMLQKDDGSAVDMFAAAMTCNTTPSGTDGSDGILTSFQSGENVLAAGDSIKLLTATAGGAASYYTVFITYKRTP